jgi:hypothetical protein
VIPMDEKYSDKEVQKRFEAAERIEHAAQHYG